MKIYTALLTADLVAVERWYTKLLGRGPDNRPMHTLVQCELFDEGGLALSTDEEIANRGVMFLYVDDVAAEQRRRPRSLNTTRLQRSADAASDMPLAKFVSAPGAVKRRPH